MNKKETRKKYINIRNNIKNRIEKSIIISERFLSLVDINSYDVFALYMSIGSEFDTKYLLDWLIRLGKIICLPRIINNDLVFIKYIPNETLTKNKYGISEPVYKVESIIEPNNIDLFIVPGVVFDKKMNRIGYGKGYYDRYLSNTTGSKVALAFDEQVIDVLEDIDDNDIKMDIIITDNYISLL